MANKAFKFRIYPNTEQRVLFAGTFGCVRLVYNHYLDKKIKLYQADKSKFSYKQCSNDMTILKKNIFFCRMLTASHYSNRLDTLMMLLKTFLQDQKQAFRNSNQGKIRSLIQQPAQIIILKLHADMCNCLKSDL